MARSRLTSLEAAIANLAEHPTVNRVGPVAGVRLLIAQCHKVLYEVRPDSVRKSESGDVIVLRIYGPGQSGD